MSFSLRNDILNAVKESDYMKTGYKTPEFRRSTPPPPPTSGSNAVKPNPNYIPPATVKETCTYKTPCGWCIKWDKKCDKKTEDEPHKDIVLEEIFDITRLYAKSSPMVKQIKVTTYFWNYLNNKFLTFEREPLDSSEGVKAAFTGIPVVVDDTIKHPFYELVF